ncbi:MAG: B12-binding domain-containing protein [Phycisphaerae bacterium]
MSATPGGSTPGYRKSGKDDEMELATLFKQYLEHLFAGRRAEAREVIFDAHDRGETATRLLRSIIWPAMEQVEKLHRNGHINTLTEHMATRINRMIADQLHLFLAREPKHGKRMVVINGEGEIHELGAQIMSDIFEAQGWHVVFLGSNVPADEILQLLGKEEPDVLAVYGAVAGEVPQLRHLIELIREVGICPDMQVLVAGGVFNRAEGLHEEIKADLYARSITEAVVTIEEHPIRVPAPDVPQPGRRRKRRRRKPSLRIAELKESLGLEDPLEKQ